ncbi:hypothetical protein MO973_18220 [Paenibacillus sp. TRM 82003]|nr:hypothetical protein [Paenibacillus sp. TRM 82003]
MADNENRMTTIDFKLNQRYSPLEQAVFLSVGQGFTVLHALSDLFYIFSEDMLSKAMERLVNDQLLQLRLPEGTLAYAPAVKELLDACGGQVLFAMPDDSVLSQNDGLLTDRDAISSLLQALDPERDWGFLSRSIVIKLEGRADA